MSVFWVLSTVFILRITTSLGHPLCLDLSAPSKTDAPLRFCSDKSYSEYGCCTFEDDKSIEDTFHALKLGDSNCAGYFKQLYCSQCDPFSAHLFGVEASPSKLHNISLASFYPPFLCSKALQNATSGSPYCTDLYNACTDVPVANSPFAKKTNYGPFLEDPSTPTTLNSYYPSASEFCTENSENAAEPSSCYAGVPYQVPEPSMVDPKPVSGICVEKISTGFVTSLVPHPDGSERAFATVKSGKIFLVNLPNSGNLTMNASAPFLDLSSKVNSYGDLGLVGLSFHPNFKSNGRFYVSYHCDSETAPNKCNVSGFACPCSEDLPCSTSQGGGQGFRACRNATVVAEYLAFGSSPLKATRAVPVENRRIFTYGIPFDGTPAGQIRFGPVDGNLYLQLGDSSTASYNVSQNLNILLGKILRIDVNDQILVPSKNRSLYGQYNIPAKNPYYSEWRRGEARGEVFALGFRAPSACTFDRDAPTYLFCADLAMNGSAVVHLVKKGGNYGWGLRSSADTRVQDPVLSFDPSTAQPPLVGGYVSRSTTDSCLSGRYLFNDASGTFHAGMERPRYSGRFLSSRLSIRCSASSPMPCSPFLTEGAQLFRGWAEANDAGLYVLATNGIFRVVSSSECGFSCTNATSPPPVSPRTPSPALVPAASNPPPSPVDSETSGEEEIEFGSREYWLRVGIVLGLIVFWSLFAICGFCVLGYYRYNKDSAHHHEPMYIQRSEYSTSEYGPDSDEGGRRMY